MVYVTCPDVVPCCQPLRLGTVSPITWPWVCQRGIKCRESIPGAGRELGFIAGLFPRLQCHYAQKRGHIMVEKPGESTHTDSALLAGLLQHERPQNPGAR